MKIKIDDLGGLYIFRRDEFRIQKCPYIENHTCGEWCPLFTFDEELHLDGLGRARKRLELKLCNRTHIIDSVEYEV